MKTYVTLGRLLRKKFPVFRPFSALKAHSRYEKSPAPSGQLENHVFDMKFSLFYALMKAVKCPDLRESGGPFQLPSRAFSEQNIYCV